MSLSPKQPERPDGILRRDIWHDDDGIWCQVGGQTLGPFESEAGAGAAHDREMLAGGHRGALITVEGLDGTGKSSLCDALFAAFRKVGHDAVLLREPGGVIAGEMIRKIVKDPAVPLVGRSEILLYSASRAQVVEEAIVPALRRGAWVICDRFVDSTMAYQGFGQGLGPDIVEEVNAIACGDLRPDLTLLLEADLNIRRQRMFGEGARAAEVDRYDNAPDAFLRSVADGYEYAAKVNSRIARVDAGGTPSQVLENALSVVASRLDLDLRDGAGVVGGVRS